MSIATAIQAAQAKIAAAYTECNAKGATMPSAANQDLAHLDDTIASIPAGGGSTPVTSKDVNFYDYEGTIFYSYTKAEFLALTAMPSNPSHQGLTAQGWNWNLTDAKAYVSKYGKLNIGQKYITDDGKTRLYIRIASEGRMDVPLNWSQTVSNGVVIDWGDGSSTQTFGGTGNKSTTHTYSTVGNYIISFEVVNGKLELGDNTNPVIGLTNALIYSIMLVKAEIGNRVTSIRESAFKSCYSLSSITISNSVTSIGIGAFQFCISLSSITIPNSVTKINSNAFARCYSLSSITIPNSVKTIDDYLFNNCFFLSSITIPDSITWIRNNVFTSCFSLSSITIPDSITSISNSMFQYCYSLSSIAIPDSITTINSMAFSDCNGMKYYYFYPTVPPTLAYTNVFKDIPSDAIIYVPATSVDSYKTATNWKAYASYIKPMP